MWQALIPLLGSILDKVLPDQGASDAAKLEVLKLAQSGDLAALAAEKEIALAQLAINQAEATTDNFRGGWRPATGWACVAGLVYQFLLMPLLPWLCAVFGKPVPPLPAIDIDTLMVLLTGLLGLGSLRTLERVKGKA